MPTYTVYAPVAALTSKDKQRLATAITRTHNEVTGAQKFFAQVMFVDTPLTDWFMGGEQVPARAVFVQGHIRSGRTPEMKQALLTGLQEAVSSSAGVPRTSVWVYVIELPPEQMVEYGHVLPKPGGEAEWLAALPTGDRALIESTGASHSDVPALK